VILRLKAGDGQQKRVAVALSIAPMSIAPITISPMSIQLHSTSAATALLAAAAGERAHMRNEGLARAAVAARAAVTMSDIDACHPRNLITPSFQV
jgi:hypothetical protein